MEHKLHFKNLDASRFFAFLLVFLAHCFVSTDDATSDSAIFKAVYNWGKLGVLGLEYFFVLSSFLISAIILREKKETGDFNMTNFLVRRTLRVWPLYFLILGIGYLLVFVASRQSVEVQALPSWPYLFFFFVNFYIISHGSEFLFFIAFLWSISVEEQFYLIWSFFMKFIRRRFVLFCYSLILISLIFRMLYLNDASMLYFHTISALGNFGIGGLLAHGVFHNSDLIHRVKQWSKKRNVSVYLLMFLSMAFYHQLMEFQVFLITERLIYSLFFAFFILEQSQGENRWFNCDRLPAFSYFGKISYGLYCYHGVVITLFLQLLPHAFPTQSLTMVFLLFPLLIFISTILLSHLSYRFFERYFLTLKQKFYTFNP